MPTRKTREELDAEMSELNTKSDGNSSDDDHVLSESGNESDDRSEVTKGNEEPVGDMAELTQGEFAKEQTGQPGKAAKQQKGPDKVEQGKTDQETDEKIDVTIDGFLENKLKVALESLLFAASEPVSVKRLTEVLKEFHPEVNIRLVRKLLLELHKDLRESARGIRVSEVANSYQLRTPSETAQYIKKMVAARPPRLTRATLETLAIVAYRQPITRSEVEDIRGVDCGAVLRHLLEKKLVKILGRKDEPGRPLLYATTSEFLVFFGLKDLKSLPTLKDFVELTDEHKAQLGLDPSESQESKAVADDSKAGFEGLIDAPGDTYSPVGTDEVITELAEALDELRSKNKALSKSDVMPLHKDENQQDNEEVEKKTESKDENASSENERSAGEVDDG